jgi:hypothetical protein
MIGLVLACPGAVPFVRDSVLHGAPKWPSERRFVQHPERVMQHDRSAGVAS